MSTTPFLGLTEPAIGNTTTWGQSLNNNSVLIDNYAQTQSAKGLRTYNSSTTPALVGAIDGSNQVFTSPVALDAAGVTFMVFWNGLKQVFGVNFTLLNSYEIQLVGTPSLPMEASRSIPWNW